jgi:hypothetical protein
MNKKTIALGGTLLTLGALVFGTQTAFAYRGDPSVQGPDCSPERHEAMTQAFDNNDYNAWKELMNGKGRVSEVINEENFAKFAEAHKLALSGDKEGAEAIRKELGLGLRDGSGRGRGQGVMDGSGDGNGRWKTE